jgi:hypothetical protein
MVVGAISQQPMQAAIKISFFIVKMRRWKQALSQHRIGFMFLNMEGFVNYAF